MRFAIGLALTVLLTGFAVLAQPEAPKPVMTPKKFGWRPDPPGVHKATFQADVKAALPSKVSLKPLMPPIYDQGDIGSCGPNSAARLIEYARARQKLPRVMPSRLYVYYNTRAIMGTIDEDSGVYNSTLMQSLRDYGYCSETVWPYAVSRFRDLPPQPCYAEASVNKVSDVAGVAMTVQALKEALAAGHPVLVGFTCYESFVAGPATRTGDIPMPKPSEDVIGGHDVVLTGYDDATGRFDFDNSWGASWGNAGAGRLYYQYLTAYADSPYVVNSVPGAPEPPPAPTPTYTFVLDSLSIRRDGNKLLIRAKNEKGGWFAILDDTPQK